MAKNKKSVLTGTLNPIEQITTMPEQVDTGKPLADVETNLANAQAKYKPGSLTAFQKVMQGVSQRLYAKKQDSDMGAIAPYMNPTQVSGQTFSSVMEWLEQERGKPLSEIYSSTMKTYITAQEMLQSDIQNLRTMKYNIQNNIQEFKLNLIKNAPGVYESMSKNDKESIDVGMPSKNVYKLMDIFSKDVYGRQKRQEEMEMKMKQEEHDLNMKLGQMKLSEGTPEQKRLKFVNSLQEAQQDMVKRRQERQKQAQPEYTYFEGGGEMATGNKSDYGMYNDISDYWDNFWDVMKNSPEADPLEVQKFLIDGLSPSDRTAVDFTGEISENIESGIFAAKKIVEAYEKQYKGEQGVIDAFDMGDLDSTHYNQYMEAKTKLMIYQ